MLQVTENTNNNTNRSVIKVEGSDGLIVVIEEVHGKTLVKIAHTGQLPGIKSSGDYTNQFGNYSSPELSHRLKQKLDL